MPARDRRGSGADDSSRLPVVLTMGCLVAGVGLFLSSTAPALREQSELRQLEQRQRQLKKLLALRNRELRGRVATLDSDPQTLLVEIDRLGLTPEELLAMEIPGLPDPPATEPEGR